MPKPSDAYLEEALTDISRIALRGRLEGTGYIFYANEVREVLQRVRDEATKAERERAAGNAEAFSSRTAYAHDIAAAIRAGEE